MDFDVYSLGCSDDVDHLTDDFSWLAPGNPTPRAPLFGSTPITTTMTEDSGYVIKRKAVPLETVQKILASIPEESQPPSASEKSVWYPASELVHELLKDFIEHCDKEVGNFLGQTRTLSTVGIGIFRPMEKLPPRTGKFKKGYVFITVALSLLDYNTGWWTIEKGSHQQSAVSEWVNERLEPCDIIVWRGDLVILETPGGGGKFINATYEITS